MSQWNLSINQKENPWFYFKVKVDTNPLEPVDLITWKQIVLRSLRGYYGLIGESMEFDLLHRVSDDVVLLRCHTEDKNTFTNALTSSLVSVDNVQYSMLILSKSAYLNGVI